MLRELLPLLFFSLTCLVPYSSQAGWFTRDGDNFAECMENRRDEIKNKEQQRIATGYCRSKFPNNYVFEPPFFYSINLLTEGWDEKLAAIYKNVEIQDISQGHEGTDYGRGIKSHDYVPYFALTVFNKNNRNIDGLIIGTTDRKDKTCTYNVNDYKGTYSCRGSVLGNSSGVMKCYVEDNAGYIKKVEKELEKGYCKIGFLLYGRESDVTSIITDIKNSSN